MQTIQEPSNGNTFAPGCVQVNDRVQVNAQRYEASGVPQAIPFNRRDYYKIWIAIGESRLFYANRSIHIDRPALIFSNPLVPYSFESISDTRSGYWCIFTDAFLKTSDRAESLQESPLFKIGSESVFFLDDQQLAIFTALFEKIIAEIDGAYLYKHEVIKSYINLILHEAMKMRPSDAFTSHRNASERIANLFLELLERQFPITATNQIVKLRRASDYAASLSIHVNHLNYAVRQSTGRSTSQHIAERILNEARALLRHTDWSIADIGYCLGFEYPNHFNNFFKKNAGVTPLSLRK